MVQSTRSQEQKLPIERPLLLKIACISLKQDACHELFCVFGDFYVSGTQDAEHGGGELSSKVLKDSIMLADPSGGGNLSGYISSDYIFDSIKHNRLQDLKKYRLKPLGKSSPSKASEGQTNPRPTTSKILQLKPLGKSSPSKVSEGQTNPRPTTSKILQSRKKGGRQVYTKEEDLALMLFVRQNKDFHAIKGNSLYKKAAKANVTNHTWQSMRDHYLKVLLHKGRKPRDFEKQILKENQKKLQIVVKEKSTNHSVGQTSLRPFPRSQTTVSPKKKTNTEQDELISDYSSVSDAEDVDYDKMFDDNLLQLANESKLQKDRNEVERFEIEEQDENENTKDPSNQEPKTRVVTRRMKMQMDEQGNVSDFDGEVSFREDSNRHSTDDEENKRPMAKRSRKGGKDVNETSNNIPVPRRSKRHGKVANEVVDKSPLFKMSKRHGLEVQDGHDKSPVPKQSKRDGKEGYAEGDKSPSVKVRRKEDLASVSQGGEALNANDGSSYETEKNKEDLVRLLNGVEDEEVKRRFLCFQALQTSIQKLESQWTVPQIIHSLLINSGMLDDAENYLQHGTAGKDVWSSEEDKILLSKDEDAISNLAKKRGLQSVLNRINFIEGIN